MNIAQYKDLIQKYNLKPISYLKKGTALIVETKDNKYVIKYCSDNRIYQTTYILIN